MRSGSRSRWPIVRGRTLGRVQELLAPTGDDPTVPIDPEGVDVEQGVRVLLDRTKAAEWTATQVERDRAALLDIIGVGIVRLDDDLRVDVANLAAHQFLRRAPGSLVGRSAIEAFIDPTHRGGRRSWPARAGRPAAS